MRKEMSKTIKPYFYFQIKIGYTCVYPEKKNKKSNAYSLPKVNTKNMLIITSKKCFSIDEHFVKSLNLP